MFSTHRLETFSPYVQFFFVSDKVFCALEYHALKDYGYIFKQDGEYKLAEVISSLCSVAYVRIAGLLVAFLCDLKVSLS